MEEVVIGWPLLQLVGQLSDSVIPDAGEDAVVYAREQHSRSVEEESLMDVPADGLWFTPCVNWAGGWHDDCC